MTDEILVLSNTQARELAGKLWSLNGDSYRFHCYDPSQPGQPPWRAGAEGQAYPLHNPNGRVVAYLKFFRRGTPARFARTKWLIQQQLHAWHPVLTAAPRLWADTRQSGRPTGADFDFTGYLAHVAPGETWLEVKFRLGQQSLPEELRWRLAADLIVAIAVLERQGFVHGDLSPGNILVNPQAMRDEPALHLIDFDAFVVPYQRQVPALTVAEGGTYGTDGYCPTDLIQRAAKGDDSTAPYSDRYARDMLLLELLLAHRELSPEQPPAEWDRKRIEKRYRSLCKRALPYQATAIAHLDPDVVFALQEHQRPDSRLLAKHLRLTVPRPPPVGPTTRTTPLPQVLAPIQPKPTSSALWNTLARHAMTVILPAQLAWRQKPRQIVATMLLAVVVGIAYGGVALHKSLLAKTTLSFGFSVDGEDVHAVRARVVTVDERPFTSGSNITLGRHRISVQLPGVEPFERSLWVFYGKRDLGTLPLESSKGSLSVTVKPSPAKILVLRDGKEIQQGDAPLKVDKLPVGDYSLLLRRDKYEEISSVKVARQQLTVADFILNLGTAQLSSEPPDAEFELTGNEKYWQGKLPIQIDDVPVGTYRFAARRKGWELSENVTVKRDELATDRIEFHYGSIEVTSDPPGLVASANGVLVGKTPTTLSELRPGKYELTVTDGENDLTRDVSVGPRQEIKHAFAFLYGSVRLSSIPPGATVIRKGKEAGKTPLTLERIPTETTVIELRLDGHVSTNFAILTREGLTTDYTVKLFSMRYLSAMRGAQQALEENQFDLARQGVAAAIESDRSDSKAIALLTEINERADKWMQQQLEAKRLATEEAIRKVAAELAAIPMLNPENIISNCWNTPNKSDESFPKVNPVTAARSNRASMPVAPATDIFVKGGEVIAWRFHKVNANKPPRFDQRCFLNKYQNKVYRYYGTIKSVEAKNQTITFAPGGKAEQSYSVSARLRNEITSGALTLKRRSPVWVSGQLTILGEANPANHLVLENSTVYSPNTLPANK